MYSEPAKFVAKLREMKTDNNVLLFKCELGAGHFSKSGRYFFFFSFFPASYLITVITTILYFCSTLDWYYLLETIT